MYKLSKLVPSLFFQICQLEYYLELANGFESDLLFFYLCFGKNSRPVPVKKTTFFEVTDNNVTFNHISVATSQSHVSYQHQRQRASILYLLISTSVLFVFFLYVRVLHYIFTALQDSAAIELECSIQLKPYQYGTSNCCQSGISKCKVLDQFYSS